MASRPAVALVFVLPAVASVALGGAVMAQMLGEPGRAGGGAGHLAIVGLEAAYAAPAAISVSVSVGHEALDCGDLDIVVRSAGGDTVGQGGFFGQCFAREGLAVPVGGPFTLGVDAPGEYEITVTMVDAQKRSRAAVTEAFTVN